MRIKRNISLYQILKTHIVRILFYFHSMPLALLNRACCFETCNTCCASINQFSCLLSSDQTSNTFSNDNSVLSDGSQKNWVDQLLAQGIKAFMCMCNGQEALKVWQKQLKFFVALHVVGSYKLVTAAMFGVSKFKRPCVRAKPSGFAVQLLNTSLVSPAKPEKSGLLQCGR